jgi:hypothetical protein
MSRPIIRNVDGQALRNGGKQWGDFFDFGTHLVFDQIPKGELWIDRNLSQEDYESALLQGQNELTMMGHIGKDEIIDLNRLIDLYVRRNNIGDRNSDVYVERYYPKFAETHGREVWLVDGNAVRDLVARLLKSLPVSDEFKEAFTEWIEGGNGFKYPFIPQNEYWIDYKLDFIGREKTVKHEDTESGHMEKGMPYKQAHELATKAEYHFEQIMKMILKALSQSKADKP